MLEGFTSKVVSKELLLEAKDRPSLSFEPRICARERNAPACSRSSRGRGGQLCRSSAENCRQGPKSHHFSVAPMPAPSPVPPLDEAMVRRSRIGFFARPPAERPVPICQIGERPPYRCKCWDVAPGDRLTRPAPANLRQSYPN